MSDSNTPERPPRDWLENWSDTSDIPGIVRKVCPNCRNYFDTGSDSGQVFCGDACKKRHKRGQYV